MIKISSLFKRNYETDRLIRNEVVPEAAWVIDGEGIPTEKIDGTSCLVQDNVLYKRYDRKVTKNAKRRGPPYYIEDCKPAPGGWEPCEVSPNQHTGHWPGWLMVGKGPEDQWHREAFPSDKTYRDGTYELVGPKIQGNPYGLPAHLLVPHRPAVLGRTICIYLELGPTYLPVGAVPRSFDGLREFFKGWVIEGIV